MELGTGDIITLDESPLGIEYFSITLDIDIKKVYWLRYRWKIELSRVISSDYDGKDKKEIFADQDLNKIGLGVSDNFIIVVKNDEARILNMRETGKNVFRNFTIESYEYFDLIFFNNKFNNATGKYKSDFLSFLSISILLANILSG